MVIGKIVILYHIIITKIHLDSSGSECSRVIGNDVYLGILQPTCYECFGNMKCNHKNEVPIALYFDIGPNSYHIFL